MTHKITRPLIAATILFFGTSAFAVPDQPQQWEKCAGIAAAGKNDCGALDGSHSCGGQSKANNSASEWIYVPKGTCEKITGGKVSGIKDAKK